MKRIKNLKEPPISKQLFMCKGCIWGVWKAPVQFCSKPIGCVRADVGEGK